MRGQTEDLTEGRKGRANNERRERDDGVPEIRFAAFGALRESELVECGYD